MVKGRNSRVIAVRVHDSVYAKIEARATKRGVSISEVLQSIIEHEFQRKR